jgi:subtilisin family serine protease
LVSRAEVHYRDANEDYQGRDPVSRTSKALILAALFAAIVSVGSGAAQAGSSSTYVVVLRPGASDVSAAASGLARANGGTVGFVYEHALRGFSIRVPAAGAAGIAHSPLVDYVEADQVFGVTAQSLPTGVQRIFASANPAIGIDGVDDKRVDVDVAVIDTGIDLDHPDLNVAGSINCATFFATCGAGGDDGNGHGTHVAGTVGALDNGIGVVGVAPGARLWAVRVLGNSGTGTTSQIIAGMDWVTARASTIEVANMSLSGGASTSIDTAANRMADAGVAVAVAAGNNSADAANYSPARAAKVLTVSALADYDGLPGALSGPSSNFCFDQDDTLADFSNWGSTIEIAAPGCYILSSYLNGGYAWINGTSMASPHAAGALALLASKGFARSYAGVSGLYSTLVSNGNSGWADESPDGVKEPLLDVHAAVFTPKMVGDSGPPPNQPPIPSFTSSCSGLTCSFDGSASSDDGTIASYAWSFGDTFTGSGVTSSHTYGTDGTYAVTLTVTDNDGAQASKTNNVTASAPPANIVSLSSSSVLSGSRWTANVTIAVTNNGSPVATSVSGTWSNGATGSGTCSPTTCTVSKSGIRTRTTSVTFTVTSVGGSSSFGGTPSITVPKP